MAQVLAEPKNVRHGFSYKGKFNHDFGRNTGIAATIKGNILLCDYVKKNVVLVDPRGNYLQNLDVDSEPYDVAITSKNIVYITQPNSNSVLQIEPDRMIVLNKATCSDLDTNAFCVSAAQNTEEKCFLGMNTRHVDSHSYAVPVIYNDILGNIYKRSTSIGARVVKFHAVNEKTFFYCTGGQNYISYTKFVGDIGHSKDFSNIDTMDIPTDICPDDYGHIYVSGQGSNNIHRLTEDTAYLDWKVLDIPLSSKHGLNEPVSLRFNKDYSKLYIVNDWGKSVLIFDVI